VSAVISASKVITSHDWHEQDRAFLRSLRAHTLRQLRTLGARLWRVEAPKWQRVAVEREIERRET